MMAFSRVAYVCKVPTRVPADIDVSDDIVVRTGHRGDLARFPEELLSPGRREKLEARLEADEILVVGEVGGRIVSCTWLRRGGEFALHHLPEHRFRLGPGVGYGYDAWTDPTLRGRGIRRAVFAEELRILEFLGCSFEVSYFVDHQLDGGRRNLARIGVPLVPLWKMAIRPGGTVALEALSADAGTVTPCFDYEAQEATA
jgi:hypothetical protein